jgi:hypothetical protein
MGKYLQIRVLAETDRSEALAEVWPALSAAAKPQGKGVLALVDGLFDQYNYGDLDEALKNEIKDDVLKAVHLKDQLEAALADWDPREADRLSYEIEDALGELNSRLPSP